MSVLLSRCRESGAVGLIVNVQEASWWTLNLLPGRHWYAIRMLSPRGWALHDSNDSSPQTLADDLALCELLQRELRERGAQVLIVQQVVEKGP